MAQDGRIQRDARIYAAVRLAAMRALTLRLARGQGGSATTALVPLGAGVALTLAVLLAPAASRPLRPAAAVLIGAGGALAWWRAAGSCEHARSPRALALLFLAALVADAATRGPLHLPGQPTGGAWAAVRGGFLLAAAATSCLTIPAGLRNRPPDEWLPDAFLLALGLTIPLLLLLAPSRGGLASMPAGQAALLAGTVVFSFAAGSLALWPRPPAADPGQAVVVAVGAFGAMLIETGGLAGWGATPAAAARLDACAYLSAALLGLGGVVRTGTAPRPESLGLVLTVCIGVLAAISPWLATHPDRFWGLATAAAAANVLAFRLVRAATRAARDRAALATAADRELRAAQRLRALDEMKTTFLRAVSHDLRTPLTVILGTALTLERGVGVLPDDELRELVGRLGAGARKLDRLLADLLDLDRLSRGVLEPSRRPTDLGALVRTVAGGLDALAGRPLHLHDPGLVAALDAPKVERIVENLLINAARYTPAGSPIWVRLERGADGVLLVVEDAGPGVPRDQRAAIFEAFRQGPGAPAHAPGVGIGLSLVLRFAELHGGRAWVQDRRGGGASFRVLLPDGLGTALAAAGAGPGAG